MLKWRDDIFCSDKYAHSMMPYNAPEGRENFLKEKATL